VHSHWKAFRKQCVVSIQGGLLLEGCDIAGNSMGVVIGPTTDPVLRANYIHHNRECGVAVFAHGCGTLEDNDIASNDDFGVRVLPGADPVVRANRIYGNHGAVDVDYGSLGTYEDNCAALPRHLPGRDPNSE